MVVIPWRGFRCFTLGVARWFDLEVRERGCNPLAGI